MKFSYNWLKEYVSGKMPEPNKLGELLMFHSFEIESIEKFGKDWVLDICILSNRAHDCLSHIGIAREVCALTGLKFNPPTGGQSSKLKEDKNLKIKDLLRVEVDDPDDCPRYSAIYLKDIQVKDSPKWIQERLKACGLQAINNIVDITNYVMLEIGQPLHAFDADKLGKQIIVRRANKGEIIRTLDKEKKAVCLDESILVIADLQNPVAVAGIKGGEETSISKKTKNIVVEAANFNPVLIRKASQKLKIRTDASWRSENGLDPNMTEEALIRVAYLIQKTAGGKLASGKADFYPKKILAKKIKLSTDYVSNLLGFPILRAQCQKILALLGFKCQVQVPGFINVTVPTRRMDVSLSEDLAEEIGRVFGYQNIKSVFPQAALIPPARNDDFFWQSCAKKILKELGFYEAYNYSFVGEKEKENFNWPQKQLLEIENPGSSLNKYLRPSLAFGLLRNIRENLKNFNEVKIFEIGSVFQNINGAGETKMIAGVFSKKGKTNEGFFELKGAAEELLNGLGISDVWYDDIGQTPDNSILGLWHPGKSAEVKVGTKEIGFLGEVQPRLLEELGIKESVFMFEMDFGKLAALANEETEYEPIVFHPAVFRDLAVLVPQGTKTVEILNVIYAAGGNTLRDVDLFDIYSGEEIEEGKENLAFHIVYQSESKTLTSGEVDEAHNKIIAELEKNPEWEIRK
ncbi:MAG: phenylalanine--tRNA ligase subunit beta [Candidatus Pacebacteria bacterium]|nr:phenylalanine--tRNA ligase subunit beta [Candidatus Paceibacterota bacterium]